MLSPWNPTREGTPLQFCGPSISTDLCLCVFSLQTSSRQGNEGPWVWLAYRAGRCLFSSHTCSPCFLTFVRRVHSQTSEGGMHRRPALLRKWVACMSRFWIEKGGRQCRESMCFFFAQSSF